MSLGRTEVRSELLNDFASLMRQELEELAAQSATSAQSRQPVELDQQSVGRISRVDAMQVQALAQTVEKRRQARVALLHRALRKIETGEYGVCEGCEEDIAEGRLRVDPAARHCVRCAEHTR